MGNTQSDLQLTVKILTRDNPFGLRKCLKYLYKDITKTETRAFVVVIDDSQNQIVRESNRKNLNAILDNKKISHYYLGKEEFSTAYDNTYPDIKKFINLSLGRLGSGQYLPSRAKNISQLFDINSTHNLLLDDDILINPQQQGCESIIAQILERTRHDDTFTSVNLMGFPDLSLLQLLERSFINDENNLHNWNVDDSSFSLSGGFLVYPRDIEPTIFPNLYNEDYLWVAVNSVKNNKKTLKLQSKIGHRPSRLKTISSERLDFEAIGEIAFTTLNEFNIRSFINLKEIPNLKDIDSAICEYCSYVEYLVNLVSEKNQKLSIKSPYLNPIPYQDVKILLNEHLTIIYQISNHSIQKVFQEWNMQQMNWNLFRKCFSKIISEMVQFK